MMKKALWLVAVILIIVGGIILLGRSRYPVVPSVGSPAPGFTLNNQEGKSVSLKDYRGQWVALYFYNKDFDKGTTEDVRSFQRDQQKLAELHAVVLGIGNDPVQIHKDFANQEQLHFSLLSDDGRNIAKQYGSFHRTHFVLTSVVYTTFIIDPNGTIARVLDASDPSDQSKQVLSAISALQHQ